MNIGGDAKDTFPTLAEQDKTHFDTSKLLQWETVFTHADALGIFLHFQLAETENGNENYHDGGTLGPERKLFYRELIARFGHHLGLEWDLGEENDYGTAKRIEFAAHLKALDPYDHPVTTHIHTNQMESFYGPLVGNDDFDITAFQITEGGLANGAEVEEWRERSALAGVPWVVSIDEPQTIHNDPTDEVNGYPNGRKDFLWPIYLSGGGGFEWYVQQDGGGHSFDQQIDDFRLMEVALQWTRYARDFMAAIPFDQMNPDQGLGSTTAGGTTYVLALPGVTYALYNDEGGTFSLDLTGQAGTYEVTWFDPENGTWHVGSSVVGGRVVSLGAPPFAGDAAVLVSTDPTAPVASFTATPGSGDVPLDVTFDASGSFAPGQIVSWAWDFGDGSSGQGEVVDHTFVAPGVYTVLLTITDDQSKTDDASTNVVAFDPDAQTTLYIPAATAPSLQLFGNMTTSGTYAGGADPDPDADSLLPELLYSASTTNSLSGGSGDEAHYTVTLPIGGTWYLYGRFLYPGTQGSNDANSFLARVGSGPALKFGNNKDHFQAWHWDGDGNVENGALVPLSLGFLSAGVHTLVIEKREVEPVAPRIDILYLTSDPSDVPTDEAAAEALFGCVDCCEDCCVVDADCDDGNPCNGDESCQAQACVPGEAPVCGTCELCDPSTGCRADPWGGCKVSTLPLQSSLLLRHKGGPGDKLVWRWRRGEATGPADFGDPYTTDGVSFCVFDETTPAPTVFVAARAEAGGMCGTKPCWAEKSGMPLYKDSSASSSGLVRIAAKEAEAGKGVITLKGKDAGLGIPALPAPEGLLVQLRSDAGVCWETRFSAAGVLRNDEKVFKARDVPIP